MYTADAAATEVVAGGDTYWDAKCKAISFPLLPQLSIQAVGYPLSFKKLSSLVEI